MTDEEKLLAMFDKIHGIPTTGSCYVEVAYDEYHNATGVHLMKNGDIAWTAPKLDLLFDYTTQEMTK